MDAYVEVVLHTSLYHTRIALVKRLYSGVAYVMFILNGAMLNCVNICVCQKIKMEWSQNELMNRIYF